MLPTPNITVKCITFLLCICEVPGSNFNLEADYSEVSRTSSDSLGMLSGPLSICFELLCKLLFTEHYI